MEHHAALDRCTGAHSLLTPPISGEQGKSLDIGIEGKTAHKSGP